MDFIFKVSYYGATAVCGLIMAGVYLSAVFSAAPGETWRHKAIAAVAAGVGFGLLYFGFQLGHQQERWAAGLGLTVAALVVSAVVMFGELLAFTKIHWQ